MRTWRDLTTGALVNQPCILCYQPTSPWMYTLSLHDALPISESVNFCVMEAIKLCRLDTPIIFIASMTRSEERFSRNAETDLVCRLLLEKKIVAHSRLRTVHLILSSGCRRLDTTHWTSARLRL